MPQSNPTLRFIYRNTGTDLYEMYMGEDKYMVFETEPKYEMVSRDYNNMIEKWNCDEQPTCIDPLYKEERHTLI